MSRTRFLTARNFSSILVLFVLLGSLVCVGPSPVSAQGGEPANLITTIDITPGGTGTRLLLGDVNGDGRIDIVTMQPDYMAGGDATYGHYVSALAAFDVATGQMIWRIGTPDPQAVNNGSDIPAQIYDIDGDGYNEVLAIMNNPPQLRVFDGRTAELKATRSLPVTSPANIARDAIMIANFRGLDFPQDIVLKDRYNRQWAYAYDTWTLLWSRTDGGSYGLGHYPWPYDWDKDGKDEVMAGFRLLDDDGSPLWAAQGLADHADSMWVGDINEDGEVEVVIGGGTNAVVVYNRNGYELMRTTGIRESQNVMMGYFRPDLPGMQVAGLDRVNRSSTNGQDGLFLIGSDGNLIWHEQRLERGASCWGTIPELINNWDGTHSDQILVFNRGCGLDAGVYDGYLRDDGYGNVLETIPINGRMMHGNLCGDDKEEVVVYLQGTPASPQSTAYIYSHGTCDLTAPPPGTPAQQGKRAYNFSRYTAGETAVIQTVPPVAPTVPHGTNLALGKPKTASGSSTGSSGTLTAQSANDGNPATRWQASSTAANHWWKVDLGADYELTGSQVTWQYARQYRYRVEVSRDNTNWAVVVDKTGNTSTDQTQADSFSALARYVRVTITDVSPSAAASIYEFQVFGGTPTPPVITPVVSGTAGDNDWYVSDVTVNWDIADETAITAMDGCSETVISNDTAGDTLTCTATSFGGTSSASVTVKRDATRPDVSVTGVEDSATYVLGSVPAAGCDTQDALSGVATPASASVTGGNANGVGAFTATCSGAVDNAGNNGSASVTYAVIYDFSGFFAPVENLPMLNIANSGLAIPLKWRITDANGNPVTNLASVMVTVEGLSCPLGATPDQIGEYAAGASGLQNLDDGYYQFNWKSPKTYANSCKTMKLDLGEGPGRERIALFQFTK